MKIFIGLVLFLLTIPLTLAVIREGNCLSGETCMFSIYSENDSHIGSCNFFNKSICYPGLINIRVEETCSVGECVLSQYKQNDSHIAQCNYYNFSLCIDGASCEAGVTCSKTNELFSINKLNNSHVGSYSYYDYKFCCDTDEEGGGGGGKVPEYKQREEIPRVFVATVKKPYTYAWLAIFCLFLFGWKRRRKRCYGCKIKFKKRKLILYKGRVYCKKCLEKQKGK